MNWIWSPVSERVALAVAGAPCSVWSGSPVTYALGPAALVVVLEAGDRPGGSAVHAADEVILRPPLPDEVVAVLIPGPDRLPIRAFARVPGGCVPLGGLRVSSHVSGQAPGTSRLRFEECRLRIDQRLPFSVLDQVRPVPATQLPDLEWLDLLPADPVGALRGFVTGWFADAPAATYTQPTTPVPAALAALYAAAAGRSEALGGFNRIFTPDLFQPADDGLVVFGTECQGVWHLLMDPAQPDPAVIYDDLGAGPVIERERLAAFLVQFSLCDAAIGSPYGGYATADHEAAQRLITVLRPVPLQPLHWPADPTRLYAGAGLAVAICPADAPSAMDNDPKLFEIYAGSRHRAALRHLRERGIDWLYFTG